MNAAVRGYLVEKVIGMEDEEILESLYGDYLSSLDAGISDMRGQLASGDFVMLDKTAHMLKGATSTVGDAEMFDAVIRLRDAAKASDAAGASSAAAEIESLRAAR